MNTAEPSNARVLVVALDAVDRDLMRVNRTAPLYPSRGEVDALPDLIIEWDRTRPIETVWSPTIGLLHEPYTHWRTGGHRNGGLLVTAGPNTPRGRSLGPVDAPDSAATVAGLLGVPLPDVEGRPLFGVAPASPAPAMRPAMGVAG